jgi:hypothetical protein
MLGVFVNKWILKIKKKKKDTISEEDNNQYL